MDATKLKGSIPDNIIGMLPNIISKYEINTPLRLAHFLAQASHESMNFKITSENLNYGAEGLRSVFSKYFPTKDKALLYERKPEKIANLVYGNRMGNGPETSGDGYRFRGRGHIQLTGKENYLKFGKEINEDLVTNPDLVATKYPLASAAWFFKINNINSISDSGSTDEIITRVSKKVNGGVIGLEERIKNFKKYYSLL